MEEVISKFTARFAGYGGQGNILAGMILAQAATIERKFVVQTQNHGAQQQGGVSRSDVIISNSQINYPEAHKFHALVCLNQEVLDIYAPKLRSNRLLVLDTTYANKIAPKYFYLTRNIVAYPFSRVCQKMFKKEILANIITLGIIAKQCGIVDFESMKEAVRNRVPKHTTEMNMEALQMGYEMKITGISLDQAMDLSQLKSEG